MTIFVRCKLYLAYRLNPGVGAWNLDATVDLYGGVVFDIHVEFDVDIEFDVDGDLRRSSLLWAFCGRRIVIDVWE